MAISCFILESPIYEAIPIAFLMNDWGGFTGATIVTLTTVSMFSNSNIRKAHWKNNDHGVNLPSSESEASSSKPQDSESDPHRNEEHSGSSYSGWSDSEEVITSKRKRSKSTIEGTSSPSESSSEIEIAMKEPEEEFEIEEQTETLQTDSGSSSESSSEIDSASTLNQNTPIQSMSSDLIITVGDNGPNNEITTKHFLDA